VRDPRDVFLWNVWSFALTVVNQGYPFPNLSLTLYPFSISTDEYVPQKCLMKKRLSKIMKTH